MSSTVGTEPILRLDGVTSGYGRVVAVDSVDLVVYPGEFVALLGPNGAGKSTLLQTISGLVRVKSGTITLEGERVDKRSAARIARLGVAHVPEGRRLFAAMSVIVVVMHRANISRLLSRTEPRIGAQR